MEERNYRKTRIGEVVSDKMDKTIGSPWLHSSRYLSKPQPNFVTQKSR